MEVEEVVVPASSVVVHVVEGSSGTRGDGRRSGDGSGTCGVVVLVHVVIHGCSCSLLRRVLVASSCVGVRRGTWSGRRVEVLARRVVVLVTEGYSASVSYTFRRFLTNGLKILPLPFRSDRK